MHYYHGYTMLTIDDKETNLNKSLRPRSIGYIINRKEISIINLQHNFLFPFCLILPLNTLIRWPFLFTLLHYSLWWLIIYTISHCAKRNKDQIQSYNYQDINEGISIYYILDSLVEIAILYETIACWRYKDIGERLCYV